MADHPFMDRARCLETLKRMRDNWLITLFAPPAWAAALIRAVQLLEATPDPGQPTKAP